MYFFVVSFFFFLETSCSFFFLSNKPYSWAVTCWFLFLVGLEKDTIETLMNVLTEESSLRKTFHPTRVFVLRKNSNHLVYSNRLYYFSSVKFYPAYYYYSILFQTSNVRVKHNFLFQSNISKRNVFLTTFLLNIVGYKWSISDLHVRQKQNHKYELFLLPSIDYTLQIYLQFCIEWI